ncbi:MAG TPA: hypothetical protein VGQ65_00280 [Thermoanaerobaculia bacterium]|jgi:hypothetical protein|nr:hypothetical protein [Thermoanaerobaculia bacterium]
MALYKYSQYLVTSPDAAFDSTHSPGSPAPHAGIYRCRGCGYEIGTAATHKLPPQDHHTHADTKVKIEWQLAVYAQHKSAS